MKWRKGINQMNRAWTVIVFAISLAFAVCQITSAETIGNLRRDTRGLSIMAVAETKSGWDKLASIKDGRAEGVVTSLRKQGSSPSVVTWTAMPNDRVRIAGSTHALIRSGRSLIRTGGGQASPVSAALADSTVSIVFPFWTQWQKWKNESTDVEYGGSTVLNGDTVDMVKITPHRHGEIPGSAVASVVTFYISRASLLPVRMTIEKPGMASLFPLVKVAYDWSGYAEHDGVLLPSTIIESYGGQPFERIDLKDVKWNTGVKDSDFTADAGHYR